MKRPVKAAKGRKKRKRGDKTLAIESPTVG